MDLTESLLRNDINHLEENIKALSSELICIQKFMKMEFGETYTAFRKQQMWSTGSSSSQLAGLSRSNSHHQCNCNVGTTVRTGSININSSSIATPTARRTLNKRKSRQNDSNGIKIQGGTSSANPEEVGIMMEESGVDIQPPVINSYLIDDPDGNDPVEHESSDFVQNDVVICEDDEDGFAVPSGSDFETGDEEQNIKTRKKIKSRNSDESDYDPSGPPKLKRKQSTGFRNRRSILVQNKERKQAKLPSTHRMNALVRSITNCRRGGGGRRQPCWKYFDFDIETGLTKCLIENCEASLKGGQYTSPLTKHLKYHHPAVYVEVMAEWEEIKSSKLGGTIPINKVSEKYSD